MPEINSEINPDDVLQQPETVTLPATLAESAVLDPQDQPEDQVCLVIREDEVPDTVLKAVLYGIAEEQASLRSLRVKKEGEDKDTSHISIKRGQLLKYMSETLIQKQALLGNQGGDIDFKGPKFRAIFKMFLELVSETFEEVNIPIEYKEMFFHALSRNFEGWEDKAARALKKASKNSMGT